MSVIARIEHEAIRTAADLTKVLRFALEDLIDPDNTDPKVDPNPDGLAVRTGPPTAFGFNLCGDTRRFRVEVTDVSDDRGRPDPDLSDHAPGLALGASPLERRPGRGPHPCVPAGSRRHRLFIAGVPLRHHGRGAAAHSKGFPRGA